MAFEATGSRMKAVPNLADYTAYRKTFSWEAAARELDGLPGGGLNIAHEAVERRLLKARELRLPERDISTLEPA